MTENDCTLTLEKIEKEREQLQQLEEIRDKLKECVLVITTEKVIGPNRIQITVSGL